MFLNVDSWSTSAARGCAILVAAKLVQVNSGAIKICRANAMVKQVMEVSGFNSLLHLYGTEESALAAFATG